MGMFGGKADNGAECDDRLLSKDFVLLMAILLGQSFMNSFFVAANPLYIARLGGSTTQAGVITTAYVLAAVAIRPVSGILADRSGRVKQMVAGAVICAVTCALYGFTGMIPLLILIRAANGIGFGAMSTCAGASVADVVPKKRLAEGIGYSGMASTLAQAVAPGIALALIPGDAIGEYRTLFILSAGICAGVAVCGCFISYERRKKQSAYSAAAEAKAEAEIEVRVEAETGAIAEAETEAATETEVETEAIPGEAPPLSEKEAIGGKEAIGAEKTQGMEKARGEKTAPGNTDVSALPKAIFGFEYAVFAPVAVMILMYVGIGGGVMCFLTPFAKWREISNPGIYFAVNAVGIFLSRLAVGKIADKRGSDIIIIPGMAVMAVCVALFPAVKSVIGLAVFALPLGIAQGAVMPTFNSMLFRRCSPARRGSASSAYFVGIDTGFAIGAPLLGAFADALDFRYIFWVGAVFIVLALVMYLLAASDKRHNARLAKNQ